MAGTTNIALTKGEYIDLGAAPALVQALGGTVSLILADAVPGDNDVGITLQQNQFYGFLQADAGSHVWGKPLSGLSVSVTPIFSSGGGGGGGAVTVADGADVAEGATTATAYADGTGAAAGTVVGILKGLFVGLGTKITAVAALPTGGIGIVGWLSRIWSALTGQGAIVTGQYKVTASAVAISGSVPLVNGVTVKAKTTNAGIVFVGPSGVNTTYDGTGNGYPLEPGASVSVPVSNLNLIFAIGTLNDVIAWEGN